MIVYSRRKLERLLKIEFVRFCIVGGSGFVINLVLLKALEHLGLSVWVAQPISAEVGLASNFMLHNSWTYKSHKVKKSLTSLIVQFHATSWPAIVGSTVMVSVGEKSFRLSNLTALMISSVIVLAWNFSWSKFVVWRNVTPQEVEKIVGQ